MKSVNRHKENSQQSISRMSNQKIHLKSTVGNKIYHNDMKIFSKELICRKKYKIIVKLIKINLILLNCRINSIVIKISSINEVKSHQIANVHKQILIQLISQKMKDLTIIFHQKNKKFKQVISLLKNVIKVLSKICLHLNNPPMKATKYLSNHREIVTHISMICKLMEKK